MDSDKPFLSNEAFQKLVIFLISVCFGTGLSAAWSISSYMFSVKNEFAEIKREMHFIDKALYIKIEQHTEVFQEKVNHQEKEVQLLYKYIAKQSDFNDFVRDKLKKD